MALFITLLTLLAAIFLTASQAAKILAVVPTPSYSHQIAFWPIWKELSLRGHQVTLITTDPIKDPTLTNLTQISISFIYKSLEEINYSKRLIEYQSDPIRLMKLFMEVSESTTRGILTHEGVSKLMQNPEVTFDLVMTEYLNPVFFALPKKFNSPFIGMLSLDGSWIAHDCVGNPTHPVLYPETMTPYTTNLTFLQRVSSTVISVIMRLMAEISIREMDCLVEDLFGRGYPSVKELACNVDMIFVNANPVLNFVRPTVPAMVQIGGGTHLGKAKPLPEELKKFIEGGEEVVYFSLGTNVKCNLIGETLINTILEAFRELPFRVIWKFEDDELSGRPENVKIVKWLPQQDLLKHPKIKVFITQGGIQSMEEALYSHVPMVCLPFIGDQHSNCMKMAQKGLGITLDPKNLDKESFKAAILEVAGNKWYHENAKRLAELASDEPMSGLEKAIWWTEYVLRHKGAKHLKGPAVELPFYQYLFLDIVGFSLVVLVVVTFIFWKAVKLGFRILCGRRKTKND